MKKPTIKTMINFSVTYKCDAWDNKEDIIKQACDNVIKHFDIKMAEVSVVLADNDFVQSLNKQYRDKDKPTNVLSFPADNEFNMEGVDELGDIIIAFETVKAESEEQEKSFDDHFTHLVVHGLLHLLGLDHIDQSEAEEMEELERIILSDMGIDDPYEGTFVME